MIDRVSARALVEAGYMPLEEYLHAFADAEVSTEPKARDDGFGREAYSVRMTGHWSQQTTHRAQPRMTSREAA